MSSVKLTQDGGLYRRITMSSVKLTQMVVCIGG